MVLVDGVPALYVDKSGQRLLSFRGGACEPSVPAEAVDQRGRDATAGDAVSCHIDCWHTHAVLKKAVIHLRVESPQPPASYLLTLSIRPLELSAAPAAPAADTDQLVSVPSSISQMSAEAAVRSRICSPTALAIA